MKLMTAGCMKNRITSRPPCGGRGLKHAGVSRPIYPAVVAPRAGGVD